MTASLGDRCFALLQHLLPKHLMSRVVHALMRCRVPWLKNLLIGSFLKGYAVNMAEAADSDPFSYPTFNAFFTRGLAPNVRLLAAGPGDIASPVDGAVSQCGRLDDDTILQAKGQLYSVTGLLGGDAALARKYRGGHFACLYLAPFNYHRIHMPLAGKIERTLYVPGDLFSVNAATVRAVPRVFARNERAVCEFATMAGSLSLVMVGALFVGSIETTWTGELNPPPRRRRSVVPFEQGIGLELGAGAEVGRFNMGSTVILLFEPGSIVWDESLRAGAAVRMGQRIGRIVR